MRNLLLTPGPLRRLMLAYGQSQLGTQAGYVGLMLLIYHRFGSPSVVSLVLIANVVPVLLLGPLMGAAADRFAPRLCMVIGDFTRCVALILITVVRGPEITVCLALIAGTGTALFRPASKSALSSLGGEGSARTALAAYSLLEDAGQIAGPALAAAAFAVAGPAWAVIFNSITFGISGLLISTVRVQRVGTQHAQPQSLLRTLQEGLRVCLRRPLVVTLLVTSAAGVLSGGMLTLTEPLFATRTLEAGRSGFAVLVLLFGLGALAGSWLASRPDSLQGSRSVMLSGFALGGGGYALAGVSPSLWLAGLAFAAMGAANSFRLVGLNQLLQSSVVGEFQGRVFGLQDATSGLSLVFAFGASGALLHALGTRAMLAIIGCGFLISGSWAAARTRGDVPLDNVVTAG